MTSDTMSTRRGRFAVLTVLDMIRAYEDIQKRIRAAKSGVGANKESTTKSCRSRALWRVSLKCAEASLAAFLKNAASLKVEQMSLQEQLPHEELPGNGTPGVTADNLSTGSQETP